MGIVWDRYKIRRATTRRTSGLFPRATTRSSRTWTANIFTVSATSTGRRPARRSRLTCTASCTCRSRRRRQIRWRWKVSVVWSIPQQLLIVTVWCAVRQLSELLSQVKDEQSYIVMRERTHRNTAESTNGRVKWWSIFQLGVLIGEGIFQVWWLKRFFEVCCTLGTHAESGLLTDIVSRSSVLSEQALDQLVQCEPQSQPRGSMCSPFRFGRCIRTELFVPGWGSLIDPFACFSTWRQCTNRNGRGKGHAGSIEDFCLIQVYGRCVFLPGKHVFQPMQVLIGTSI